MRLEMASYDVRDVRFGGPTRYDDGVLWVHRDELRQLMLASGDFADVAIEVVRPGEPVRLIHVVDAAEPRYKPDGPTDFPGQVSAPRPNMGGPPFWSECRARTRIGRCRQDLT